MRSAGCAMPISNLAAKAGAFSPGKAGAVPANQHCGNLLYRRRESTKPNARGDGAAVRNAHRPISKVRGTA